MSCRSGSGCPSSRRCVARSASLTTLLSSRTEVSGDVAFNRLHLSICLSGQAVPQSPLCFFGQGGELRVRETIEKGRLRVLGQRGPKLSEQLLGRFLDSFTEALGVQKSDPSFSGEHHQLGAGLNPTFP